MPTADLVIVINARDRASAALQSIEHQVERTASATGTLGIQTATASASFTAMLPSAQAVAAAAVAVGTALANNAKRFAAHAKSLTQMSKATGASVKGLSRLQHAFKRAGYDGEDLSSVIAEVSIKLGDAAAGSSGVQDAFDRLNLDWNELQQQAPDEAFLRVADALQHVQNAAERTHIADTIFGGDDGRKVLALAGNINELTEEADRLGITLSDSSAQAAVDFGNNIEAIEQRLFALSNTIGEQTMRTTSGLVEWFGRTIGALPSTLDTEAQRTINAALKWQEQFAAAGAALGASVAVGFARGLEGVQTAMQSEAAEKAQLQLIKQVEALTPNLPFRPAGHSEASIRHGIFHGRSFPNVIPHRVDPDWDEWAAMQERRRALEEFMQGTERRQALNRRSYNADRLLIRRARQGVDEARISELASRASSRRAGRVGGTAPPDDRSAVERAMSLIGEHDFGDELERSVEQAINAFTGNDFTGAVELSADSIKAITRGRELGGVGGTALDELAGAVRDISSAAKQLAPDVEPISPSSRSSGYTRPSYSYGGSGYAPPPARASAAGVTVQGGTVVNVYVEGYVGSENQLIRVIRGALDSGELSL